MNFEWFGQLRVLELAGVLAGPMVGRFFAEMGAKVIKVENPATGGDVTRSWKLPEEHADSDASAYFHSANWGKEHLFLDLKGEEGRKRVQQLAGGCDVVISNFRPSSARKIGIDYETLGTFKTDLIYVQLCSFERNPERPAFDIAMQAECGFLHMCGCGEGHPARMPVALIDLIAAHQAKEAVLLALLRREKEGRGAFIKLSLEASAITALANQAANYLQTGRVGGRMGTLHPNIAPYGDILRCKDGREIVLAVGSDRQFSSLCAVLGLPSPEKNDKYRTNRQRVEQREELVTELNRAAGKRNSERLLEDFGKSGVPYGLIRPTSEVLEAMQSQKFIVRGKGGAGSRSLQTFAFNIY